jgi:hypothetical protein
LSGLKRDWHLGGVSVGHPDLINGTPFALEILFVADENGVPVCVPIVKATFTLGPDAEVTIAKEQLPIDPSGTLSGDPENSSYIYEPETAFFKPATDLVLIGHAHAPAPDTTELLAGIRVGSVQKVVKVMGDRFLVRRAGEARLSRPAPFERIPLVYERAFGGWDRRRPEASQHQVESRNPVGTGFREAGLEGDDEVRMPNVEDPEDLYTSYGARPTPAGVGFVSPHWAPRSQFAGTYGDDWARTRSPLLPTDFDRRFFNAASPGLVAPGFLRGDEGVVVLNASPEGRLAFDLPAIAAPVCEYELRSGRKASPSTNLDTVIVNTDTRQLILLWRTYFPLRTGPHDLVVLRVRTESSVFAAG